MDKEKLEKAYTKFINENRLLIGNNAPLVADTFEAAVNAIMSQPLSERLTEEEREEIIKIYRTELDAAQYHTKEMGKSINPQSGIFHAKIRESYISRLRLLKRIFGTDLFTNKSE